MNKAREKERNKTKKSLLKREKKDIPKQFVTILYPAFAVHAVACFASCLKLLSETKQNVNTTERRISKPKLKNKRKSTTKKKNAVQSELQ